MTMIDTSAAEPGTVLVRYDGLVVVQRVETYPPSPEGSWRVVWRGHHECPQQGAMLTDDEVAIWDASYVDRPPVYDWGVTRPDGEVVVAFDEAQARKMLGMVPGSELRLVRAQRYPRSARVVEWEVVA
jgi:hypothetical protein